MVSLGVAGSKNGTTQAVSRAVLEGSVHQLNHQAGDYRHVHGVDEEFREAFERLSILQMVSVHQQRINEAPDQAARLFSSKWPLGVLKRLQRLTTKAPARNDRAVSKSI